MTTVRKKVAVIDSGVGGLSVLRACVQKMPQHDYVYCSDNKNYPYGTKTEERVIDCVQSVVTKLVEQHQPDIIVVACNTASTVALPVLRSSFSVPFVGVVPAIKPAAQVCQTGVMALLATPGTVQRKYVDDLIAEFASDKKVIKLGSKILVDIAERFILGETVDLEILREELKPLTRTDCDTVVLGCTHFKLIESSLAIVLPHVKNWIDSSASIANRVATLLHVKDEAHEYHDAQGLCLFTAKLQDVAPLQHYLNGIAKFTVGELR